MKTSSQVTETRNKTGSSSQTKTPTHKNPYRTLHIFDGACERGQGSYVEFSLEEWQAIENGAAADRLPVDQFIFRAIENRILSLGVTLPGPLGVTDEKYRSIMFFDEVSKKPLPEEGPYDRLIFTKQDWEHLEAVAEKMGLDVRNYLVNLLDLAERPGRAGGVAAPDPSVLLNLCDAGDGIDIAMCEARFLSASMIALVKEWAENGLPHKDHLEDYQCGWLELWGVIADSLRLAKDDLDEASETLRQFLPNEIGNRFQTRRAKRAQRRQDQNGHVALKG